MDESSENSELASTPICQYPKALPLWIRLMVLLTIFASGYVVGMMVTTNRIHSKMESYRSNAPIFAEDIVKRLRIRLSLNEKQVELVSEIIERRHRRLVESRQRSSKEMHDEFDEMENEVAGVLDEAQVKRWHFVANTVRIRFLPPKLPSS